MASVRPHVFLDINISGDTVGRLTIELFTDKSPVTCTVFHSLCTATESPKTYRHATFHHINEDLIQGGDIARGSGSDGDSIFGGQILDENLGWRDIDGPGLVCKASSSTQFFITLDACKHLNGKHTVFGRLVAGQDTLARIAQVPVGADGKPTMPVVIADCGDVSEPPQRAMAAIFAQTAVTESETDDARTESRKRRRYSSQSPSPSRSRSDSGTRSRRHNADKHRHGEASGERDSKYRRRMSREQLQMPQTGDRQRRRSDHVRDETRRGRELRKTSASPTRETSSQAEERRRRSPSPSRGPHHQAAVNGYRRRPSLPNHYQRCLGHESTESSDSRRGDGQRISKQPRTCGNEEGRLGAFQAPIEEGVATQFRGRGAMKYREKQGPGRK